MPQDSFLKRFFTKPPILFPLAALFHIFISITAIVTLYPIPLSQRDWLRPLSMLIFSALAVALCFMRKWVAITYALLSVACLAAYYYSPIDTPLHIFGESFFPFNLIVSFFVLLYFKKFQ